MEFNTWKDVVGFLVNHGIIVMQIHDDYIFVNSQGHPAEIRYKMRGEQIVLEL